MLGRLSPAAALLCAGLLTTCALITGCTGDNAPAASPADEQSVLQPGGPGDPNETVGADELDTEDEYNDADVAFLQMMIPHHAQAIEMCALAQEHAVDRSVRTLADRIRASQGPEILAMASWLDVRELDVPTAADDHSQWSHHGEGMPDPAATMGMLTERQMRQLAAARGARFDRLFLQGMIQHHQGAIDMASTVAVDGIDVLVNETADDVSVTQGVEIDRMRELLAG